MRYRKLNSLIQTLCLADEFKFWTIKTKIVTVEKIQPRYDTPCSKMKMTKAKPIVVVLSGGQDSTTCLYEVMVHSPGNPVHAVTFDYGQRHRIEINAARTIARLAGVQSHEVIKLGGGILKGTSPLISDEKLEQYESHEKLPGGLEKTFVPMRNQLFLTVAANRAYMLGSSDLVTGVSAEDFGGYPDCRRIFINLLEAASSLGTFTGQEDTLPNLKIHTPLMNLNKEQTADLGWKNCGCYGALAYSHTSYDGQYPPTGKDHATLLRAKGFEKARLPDPLILRAFLEGRIHDLPSTSNYKGNSGVYHTAIERVDKTMKIVEGWKLKRKGLRAVIREELNRG